MNEACIPFVVFGAGSFASDIFDIVHESDGRVERIYLNVPESRHERVLPLRERFALLGYEVSIHDSLAGFEPSPGREYVLGFVSAAKKRLVEELKRKHGITFRALVHPRAHMGSNVHVGEGAIINAGAIIAPNARCGDFCMINRGATVGHESHIGMYSIVGPSAAIAASCRIGEMATIGIGACVLEKIEIGRRSTIGAGSVVTTDIPEGVLAWGVPARVVRAMGGEHGEGISG